MTEKLAQEIKGYIEGNPPPEGWATIEKANAMAELIVEQRPMVVVEIGVFGGRSLIPQGMALRSNGRGMALGIDPYKKSVTIEGEVDKGNLDWWTKLDLEYIHRHAVQNIWKHNLDDWCAILRCTSQSCCTLFPAIDILHIDGAHSEVSSVRDVVNYLPRVKQNGYIWFDDTDWPTTEKAVAMVRQQCEEVTAIGSCRLFKKLSPV